jgi:AraC family transcriptional regulator of adaptative response / DNA-3-methyladenine glycosylase II
MLLEHAPASATPYGVAVEQHRRATRLPTRTQPASGTSGKTADAETVSLGIQLILDGGLDVDNGDRLAARLGVSHRRLRDLFQTHAGITPDQLARSSRAHFARRMLDDTDLPVTDIAFASGFGSLRQFNRTMHGIFRATPLALRARRRRGESRIADGDLLVRLGSCAGPEWEAAIGHLTIMAIGGVEYVDRDVYRRAIVIDGDVGALEIRRHTSGELLMRALLPHWRDMLHVIQQVRRVFNLDADIDVANDAEDAGPCTRLPGTWDSFEVAVRVIIGQERTVGDASFIASRVVERYGRPAPDLFDWRLTHTFPPAAELARAELEDAGLTPSEIRTLRTFADAVADGDGSATHDDVVMQSLQATPGVNRMTADYVARRIRTGDVRMPDRCVPQGGLRQFLGQRRSPTIRLDNSDTRAAERKSPIAARDS